MFINHTNLLLSLVYNSHEYKTTKAGCEANVFWLSVQSYVLMRVNIH